MLRCGCPFTVGRKAGVMRGEKTAPTAEAQRRNNQPGTSTLPVLVLVKDGRQFCITAADLRSWGFDGLQNKPHAASGLFLG